MRLVWLHCIPFNDSPTPFREAGAPGVVFCGGKEEKGVWRGPGHTWVGRWGNSLRLRKEGCLGYIVEKLLHPHIRKELETGWESRGGSGTKRPCEGGEGEVHRQALSATGMSGIDC